MLGARHTPCQMIINHSIQVRCECGIIENYKYHNADISYELDESDRIKKAGGYVDGGRVNGKYFVNSKSQRASNFI